MQISSRFTIALHILSCIETFKGKIKVTSQFLSRSICVNSVTIRYIMGQLKAAGLISVKRGRGGIFIEKNLEEITFLDVYKAIEPLEADVLFHFHERPNLKCPVGRHIHHILDQRLKEVQNAMENQLQKTSVSEMLGDLKENISKEKRL